MKIIKKILRADIRDVLPASTATTQDGKTPARWVIAAVRQEQSSACALLNDMMALPEFMVRGAS